MLGVGDAQAEDGPPEQLVMWPPTAERTDDVWIAGTDLGQPVNAHPCRASKTLALALPLNGH
jgi:hypothetical protein